MGGRFLAVKIIEHGSLKILDPGKTDKEIEHGLSGFTQMKELIG